MRFIVRAIPFLLLASCASLKTFDMPRVQAGLGETVQNTEAVLQKSQADFRDKTTLIENLKRTATKGFSEAEPSLQRYLKAMAGYLDAMTTRRKQMIDANGEIASMGYAHKVIKGDTPEYDKVDHAITEFENAARDINASAVDYSRESNSLADEVSSRKLFFYFDVSEFQKRLQSEVKSAQNKLESMNKALHRAESTLSTSSEKVETQETIFAEMNQTAQSYTTKAQQFSDINRSLFDLSLGNLKISTLDSNWPPIQKVLGQFDQLVKDLNQTYAQFQSANERFGKPYKRAQ